MLTIILKNWKDPNTLSNKGWEYNNSIMFVYTLKKGIRLGYIDSSYLQIAKKGWEGILSKVKMEEGKPVVTSVVQGMGIQDTYEDYLNKDRLENSTHGLCAILTEMEY